MKPRRGADGVGRAGVTTDTVSFLHQAQQSLDLIQEELSKETGNGDLIENSSLMSQTVRPAEGHCAK